MGSAATPTTSARTLAVEAAPAWSTSQSTAVAAFPYIEENPYQQLLYAELEQHGFTAIGGADFKLPALWRARKRPTILHFHWPQNYYRWWRRPALLRPWLTWLKLCVFAGRLAIARRLGFAVVWTIHEIYPHEPSGKGVDRIAGRMLARYSHLLLAHDYGTAQRAESELGLPEGQVEIVQHGSYVGVYSGGRPRGTVRAELGVSDETIVFLCFGHIRAYKEIDVLLAAFAQADVDNVALVVAGLPLDQRSEDAVRQAAAADPRIRALLEFIPPQQVGELFGGCDVAVLPRGDGGTSGVLVLALSLGLPVVVARKPDYEALIRGETAGWLFEPGDSASLSDVLMAAASDPAGIRAKGVAAREQAEDLRWPEIARRIALLMRGALAEAVRSDSPSPTVR